jgi:hypothetical protein
MSGEGSAQPVTAPTAEANSAADNGTVDTKAPEAPAPAAAEAKAEVPNPMGKKDNKEASEPAKEDEASKQAEGKKKIHVAYACTYTCTCTDPHECDHLLTIASTS